jgi:error-prone DNA polymerase
MTRRELTTLARAGAFDSMGMSRRGALWDVPASVRTANLTLPFDDAVEPPAFDPIGAAETIAWDYQAASHSTHGHPVASLRPLLQARGIPDAQTVRGLPHGARVSYAGLVICRQRPQTAKNVTFMTLEDETGFVNLVIWERVFDEYSLIARTAHWLGVTGTIQSQYGVVHLVAEELWTPREGTPEHLGSRDFH